MQLKALMGLDIEYPVIFEGTLTIWGRSNPWRDVTGRAYSLERNSDLVQMSIQKRTAGTGTQNDQGIFLPTLSLSSISEYSSMNNNFNFQHTNWFPSYSISVWVFPFSAGFKDNNKSGKTSWICKAWKTAGINSERNLQLSVKTAWTKWVTLWKNWLPTKKNVSMAEKAYSISRKQFEVGMGTWLDLSASELALTQAAWHTISPFYNYLFNMAGLEKNIRYK